MHQIGVREVVEIGGFHFNAETILMTWITMAIVILIAVLATRHLKEVPVGWQNAVEAIVGLLQGQMDAIIGPEGRFLAPLFITLFLFLLISNWLGLCPGMASPTNDLNTTLGMAVMMSLVIHGVGLARQGIGHLHHFVEPFAPFILVNLIEEMSRPATLAFRLFGNILAGEVLIIILLQLIPWYANWAPSCIWLMFSIFVGVIQAFVFTMLSITYITPSVHHK